MNENTGKQKFKLPKVKLKLFRGEEKKLSSFELSLKKVYNDKELLKEDKCWFLLHVTLKQIIAEKLFKHILLHNTFTEM